ncbi:MULTISPECIES: histidinol-phosphate transaminase [Marinobacter]|jgi:histidinol-phosphate aminotransferase|uniref:Histidinol-phosphate aminotransferase n=1 Tax=Marinobacter alkaliphilus TaxID=254719 RepID=A0ABZ3DZ29_9GAMM|nr:MULTISPECIES: histidinol-phosphate transaminase [unclassified Marinobacter]QFS87388.1 Histidinol-phosphate aminotransferase 2 [Marinobacter sp. THAF197a]QFT51172.1 Histidinol-phosphate aminotransferase 2 [Marinobacter sp. THAF39]
MAVDYQSLAVKGVQALSPYQPGKPIEELARELGLNPAEIIKLASNENPLGPSEKALAAARKALEELCLYPDGNGFELKQALANRFGVGMDQITLGNGSNDVLEVIARCFADTDSEVVFSQYAFAVYPIVTQAIGAKGVPVPAKEWGHDLDAMAAAVTERTKLVFVANPNNPTGTVHTAKAIEAFLDQIPERVLVVLDEAYCEYLTGSEYPDGIKLLERYPNLIVCRTFSKAWGLAALRVGYAISSTAIADILNRVRQPFNVDSVALAAATAVLQDEAYLNRSREVNEAGLRQLSEAFELMGLPYIPSAGNFIAVEVGDQAQGIYQALLSHGVIVRPIAGYGMPYHLRVSVGLPEENERFLDALSQSLAAAGQGG